jgi:hypothetical protein
MMGDDRSGHAQILGYTGNRSLNRLPVAFPILIGVLTVSSVRFSIGLSARYFANSHNYLRIGKRKSASPETDKCRRILFQPGAIRGDDVKNSIGIGTERQSPRAAAPARELVEKPIPISAH